jgi:hypothetical protein
MARPVSVGSVAGTLDFSTPSGAFSPSCRFAGVTSTFPEQVFAFTPASTNTFVVRTDVAATHIDTIVSVRDACTASSELACNEDVSATDLRSSLIFNGVAGQTYFVVVQASSNTSGTDLSQAVDGDFQLVIEAL